VQDCIGGLLNALQSHLAIVGMKQGEDFGGAIAQILVVLPLRLTFGVPTGSRIGYRLEGTGFILTPQSNAHALSQTIGLLD
jgi:hypothetical protein